MSGHRGPRSRRELFVWYRVAHDRAQRLRVDIETMHRALEIACPGLSARLLVRADGADAQTWMETYAMQQGIAAGIDDTVQARIAEAAEPLRDRLASDRHVESFEAVVRA